MHTRAKDRVRLPVQVGTSALELLAQGLALLVPSFVLVMTAPMLALAIMGTRHVEAAQPLQYTFWIGGAVAVGRALRLLASAYRRRPSDVVLDAETLRFDGGRHHGFELGWTEVEPETWSLAEVKGTSVLASGTGSDSDLVVAETGNVAERRSLGDLLETIQTIARAKTSEAAPAPAAPPGVLACTRCGAPLAPADAPTVQCEYCAAVGPMPDAVRGRLRHAREEMRRRAASCAAVARLLDQTSAVNAARALVIGAAVMLGAWLVGFGGMLARLWNYTLDAEHAFALVAFPLAVVLAIFCALRALFANRSALSLVAFHLGAGATSRGRPACRRCAGPLAPESDAAPVVACAYCGADNVLGLEIVRGGRVEREDVTIETALARRREGRVIAYVLAAASAVLTVAATVLLAHGA